MNKTILMPNECINRAAYTLNTIGEACKASASKTIIIYGIPRGGIFALQYFLEAAKPSCMPDLVTTIYPNEADYFIDDIIDSGATAAQYHEQYGKPVIALVDKQGSKADAKLGWVVFPWESDAGETGPTENITRMLEYIGEKPEREGLTDTPTRVIKAWDELYSGYEVDPVPLLKSFTDGAEKYDEMVVVKDISFYSSCEHHLEPVIGSATIGYIPNGSIIGLSKFSRLVDVFARRLTVQERLTTDIATLLNDHLKPIGVGVIIHARHLCIERRGVNKRGSITTTSALHGKMKTDPMVRAEFMKLAEREIIL